MKNLAKNYYQQGFSCSESIVLAAVDNNLCDKSILPVATAFSGGMGAGCLCGAVAGAQLVIGFNHGRFNQKNNKESARILSKELIDKFKEKRKTTCCRALTAKFDIGSIERKQNCTELVEECAEILENMIKIKV